MKVKELLEFIKNCNEDQLNLEVLVKLKDQSLGQIASTDIDSCYFGFDWDKDLILIPKESLTKKTLNQEVFEKTKDLLMFLATNEKTSYEQKKSRDILKKLGYSDQDFIKFKSIFHKS